MNIWKQTFAWTMAAAMLAGAGNGNMVSAQEMETDGALVVAMSSLAGDYSPFFARRRDDLTAAQLTQEPLLVSDRTGGVILTGIEGETVSYGENEYTYYGPADCTITEKDDGSVDYEIHLRDDLTFSDGVPVTIDDVIFDLYVRCDPTYDGPSALKNEPVTGLAEYRSGMDTLLNLMTAAGESNTDFSLWTQEEQQAFFADYNQAAESFVQEIVDYCKAVGYNKETDTVAQCAATWGYQLPEEADRMSFWRAMVKAHGGDVDATVTAESAGSSLANLMQNYDAYRKGVKTGKSASSISGIQKLDDYTLLVCADSMDATLIYQLADTICPLHYYGETSLYDYENNSFGFVKGDLSGIREKSAVPLGMGPYIFTSGEDGAVFLEANAGYYKGEPQIPALELIDAGGQDQVRLVTDGQADLTVTDFDAQTDQEIREINGGQLDADSLTTVLIDHSGYGYIGMNARNVCVGDDAGSEASRNLRRAFATLFAAYREEAILSYYGESARLIEYPISAVSWASPQPEEDDYRTAFSTDVDGNEIYSEEMSFQERYEAAKEAALGFFQAAGYTVEDGKVTKAPDGARLSYQVQIPGEGEGNHPAWQILTSVKDVLEQMGITLEIRDFANTADLWNALRAGTVEMWCAAWTAGVDPDMYSVYYAAVSKDGEGAGSSSQLFQIEDLVLDEMVLMAREGENRTYRKALYKACLETILEWACVVPTYQRKDAVLFRTGSIDAQSLPEDMTAFYSWNAQLQDLKFK